MTLFTCLSRGTGCILIITHALQDWGTFAQPRPGVGGRRRCCALPGGRRPGSATSAPSVTSDLVEADSVVWPGRRLPWWGGARERLAAPGPTLLPLVTSVS